MTDEADKKQDMEKLAQLEKMSSIGQLAVKAVHEIRNNLTVVVGYSEILLNKNSDEKTKQILNIINEESLKCCKIAGSFLDFSRQYNPERSYIQINDIIQFVLDLKEYQLKLGNIELELYLSNNVPKTMADPHQMQQVFMNIINNAQQAVSGYTKTGKLLIETKLKNDMIIIRFSNNGPYIPNENLARIFEPFFTTKAAGVGTGLGLGICKSIIEEHCGAISVDSREGQNTSFIIKLPVIKEKPDTASEVTISRAEMPIEMSLEILVVDDEEGILSVFTEMLNLFGHKMTGARNGNEALEKLKGKKFDLIFCDMKMPELDGEELFKLIKSRYPEMVKRVIFVAGDVISSQNLNFLQNTGNLYMSKPFTIEELRQIIARAVAQPISIS